MPEAPEPEPEPPGAQLANMDSVMAQRWFLLAGSLLSTVNILYIAWTYARDRDLHRRPGSLLFYRAMCNLAFCLVVLANEAR